jgi:hypothetical protein
VSIDEESDEGGKNEVRAKIYKEASRVSRVSLQEPTKKEQLEEKLTPVMIKVPAFSVVPCERKDTVLGIEKMRSLKRNKVSSKFLLAQRVTGDSQTYVKGDSCITFSFLSPFK